MTNRVKLIVEQLYGSIERKVRESHGNLVMNDDGMRANKCFH